MGAKKYFKNKLVDIVAIQIFQFITQCHFQNSKCREDYILILFQTIFNNKYLRLPKKK